MTCDFCGGQLGFEVYTKNGKSFCSVLCEIRFFTKPNHRKQRRYEEIKHMAWEMFLRSPEDEKIKTSLEASWLFAEKFYDFAKEKQQEKNDTL